MNILLAIDGSEHSSRAVDALLAFAPHLRNVPNVHVLYVHLPIPIGFALKHVARDVVDSYYHEEGQVIVKPAVAKLEAAGIAATSHVRVGSPGETIAHTAKELGCNSIWMGTHGRGSVTQALLGSVASRVVALAQVPVTLLK